MKIAEVIMARSVWLFDTYELNPRGIAFGPILKALVDRYHFLGVPMPTDFVDASKGPHFQDGTFSTDHDSIRADLQIYNDGIIGDTRSSTKDTDAFLEDALSWAGNEFRLNYRKELVKNKYYESQLTVHPDFDLTNVCEKFKAFAEILTQFEPGQYTAPEALTTIAFRPDPNSRLLFTFERREKVPFSENKYFSHASLPTDRHIALLEVFERILTS